MYFETKTANWGAKNTPSKIPTTNEAFPKKLATKPFIIDTNTHAKIITRKIKSINAIVISNPYPISLLKIISAIFFAGFSLP